MPFDIEGALRAGHSMSDIAQFLGDKEGFNVAGAKEAGYSDTDIVKELLYTKREPTTGFVAGLKSGYESLKGDIGAVGAAMGVQGAEEYAKQQRELAAQKARLPEFTESPWEYIKTLAGQSLPYMAAPIAGAALAPEVALGTVAGAALTGADLAATAVGGLQFFGSNLSRQLEEGKTAKDLDVGSAAAAAPFQAALDTIGLRFVPGLRRIFGEAGMKLSDEELKAVVQKQMTENLAGKVLNYGTKAVQTAGIEGFTEAGQQVLERAQAGLAINDPQARKEYFDNFLGGALLGGAIGVPGHAVERAGQRGQYEDMMRKDREAEANKPEEPPLLIGAEKPFYPTPLPDGSVAMTREDLAKYEEQQFQKQYAPQPTEEALARQAELEAAQAEAEKAAARMPTEAGLNYATATQEIEKLKSQPRTPESAARIKELQQYKMETLNDQISAAKLPVSPELKALRQQMERGDMTYEGQQRAIDKLLAEFYSSPKGFKGLEKAGFPKTETDAEIESLQKEARTLATEYKKLTAAQKSTALRRDLRGKIDPKEVVGEIGAEKEFRYLAAPKDQQGTSIADMVGNGLLDKYLPVDMRHDSETFDNQASEEYIKEKLRTGDFGMYVENDAAYQAAQRLSDLDARIKELQAPSQVQEEVAGLTDEERQAMQEAGLQDTGVAPAEEIPVEEGYYPDQEEAPRYMQATPGQQGATQDDVQAAVDEQISGWKNAPDIQVVQSLNELPQNIQDQIARDKVNPRGLYDPTTKKVWLVADNIANKAEAAITLAHEAIGHFGLRAAMGTNFSAMMNSVYEGNKAVRDRADAYIKDGMSKEDATEEVLSEMAQETLDGKNVKQNTSILRKVMNAIRQFLARLGMPINTITDKQILELLANAKQSVVEGKGAAGELAGGKAKYSARERMEKAAQRMTSKRPEMQREAFAGVDEKLVDKLNNIFFPTNETIVDRIDGMKDNFWKKLAQGVADQYRSIKDYTQEGYMLARMSKTIDGALEGLLFNGRVKLTDGALDIAPNTKGLIQAMEPVGKEVDRYQIWVALNRDAQLVRQGRVPSIDPEIVAQVNELSKGKIGDRSRLEVYEQVRKDMNALNRSVLDIAKAQGLINDEAYQIFANDINFIPFYRAMEDGDVQGAATASGLARQEFSKQLKGGQKPFADLMENTLRNWSHILSASMKNKAANVTIDAAMEMGAAYPNLKVGFEWRDGKVYSSKSGELVNNGKLKPEYTTQKAGMVKTMLDGKPAYFEVIDPLLLDSISSIGYMGPKSKFLDVAKDFKNMLQFGVTLSPAFKVRNLFRDSISAMAVSDMKLSPFANVVSGWKATSNENPAHISALAGGAIFNFGSYYEGDQSRLIKRLLKQGVSPDSILDTDEKIKKGLAQAWRKYQEWGNKSEAANRMALYQQMRDRGMSHLEASFYARDLLDFSMQGSWPAFRLVSQVVPFLNARVQGLYKLGRDGVIPTSRVIYNTVTGKPIELTDKQKAQQFGTVTGAVVLASMALYLMFKDDDEFQKREAWDRDNFWWFKLPGMDTALRVPKPFEIGAFGTLAERTLEQIIDQGAEGKQFEESLRRMLGDTFALNPTPQAIKPLLDLYANKDSFTGAPIETAGMERLSKQERASDSTSPLAKALGGISNVMANVFGEKTELSPVQIDYAIKSYFGWLGGTVSSASHYAVMPFSKGAYPDHDWAETMSLGFVKSLPATQSRYVTEFYQNSKQISEAYADMRHYAELGQSDKVQEILADKGDQIALAKAYDKSAKDMAKMRQVISAIRNDERLSGAEKKEQIDRMKLLIDEVAKQMETVRKDLRK